MNKNKIPTDNIKKQSLIFCRNVLILRKENHLTQEKMAKLLGISIHSLRSLENGKIPPRLSCDVIFRIYIFFGVHPRDIFSPLEDNKNK